MSIAEKLQTIAENEQRVYEAGYAKGQAEGGDTTAAYDEGFEAGKKAEYDAFWDNYQTKGNRANYQYAFGGGGWNIDTFKPKYDIRPTRATSMFNEFGESANKTVKDLVEHLEECGVTLDFSLCTAMGTVFHYSRFERIGVIDLKSCTASLGYTIGITSSLKTIDKIISYEYNLFASTTFSGSKALENVTFEGVIANGVVDFKSCTKLSKASIESIINHLSTTTSGLTVTLSKTAKEAAFTADEWAALIATRTNWTISLV